jgi:hypothetical protein
VEEGREVWNDTGNKLGHGGHGYGVHGEQQRKPEKEKRRMSSSTSILVSVWWRQ